MGTWLTAPPSPMGTWLTDLNSPMGIWLSSKLHYGDITHSSTLPYGIWLTAPHSPMGTWLTAPNSPWGHDSLLHPLLWGHDSLLQTPLWEYDSAPNSTMGIWLKAPYSLYESMLMASFVSLEHNFTTCAQGSIPWTKFEKYTLNISVLHPMDLWVKHRIIYGTPNMLQRVQDYTVSPVNRIWMNIPDMILLEKGPFY